MRSAVGEFFVWVCLAWFAVAAVIALLLAFVGVLVASGLMWLADLVIGFVGWVRR